MSYSAMELSPRYVRYTCMLLRPAPYCSVRRHLRKAVDLLTQNNVVHGDLPENAMLKTDGTPVLIDFAQSMITGDINLLQFQRSSFLSHFKVGA